MSIKKIPGVSKGFINREVLSQSSTGIFSGGELSINVDNTKFDVAAGSGYVIDNYTDPSNPVVTKVNWDAQIGVTPTFLATSPVSEIAIDVNGDCAQSPISFTVEQRRDLIILGVITHDDFTTVSLANNNVLWLRDSSHFPEDLIDVFSKVITKEGNAYSANGANLNIDKSAGKIFSPGINYGVNKKDPNFATSDEEIGLSFTELWRGTPLQINTNVTEIDTDFYDPNGDGTLVAIPAGFYTVHRIHYSFIARTTILQYGQFLYDSLKKAVDNYSREDFDTLTIIKDTALRCALAVKGGNTDLSNPREVKFNTVNGLGRIVYDKSPSAARFVEPVEVVDALSYQRQEITFVEDSGTIYADLEAVGGGNITYAFGQREYVLDCITGDGVDGKARVALTEGSADAPVKNWFYTTRNGDDFASLLSSITEPTGEHAMVGTIILPDITSFNNDDSYGSRRWTQAKEIEGVGAVATILKKLRSLPADYKSGLTPVLDIDSVPNPDTVDFTVSSGTIREIYDQVTDALELSVDGGLVVNDERTAYTQITDLAEIDTDALGNTLQQNNTYYQIIVAISTNTDGKTRLLINKPSGSYTTATEAFNDTNGYSVTTFPGEFETISLVCAFVLRYQTVLSGTYTNAATAFGVDFIDLRGQNPGSASQGSGSAAVTEFSDAAFKVFNSVDASKIITFDLSNLTAVNVRTITMADRDLDLANPIFDSAVIGSIDLSDSNPSIEGKDTDGAFIISSNTTTLGGNIRLFGDTHATQANDIEFRTGSTVRLTWNDDETEWNFVNGAIRTSSTIKGINVTSGENPGHLHTENAPIGAAMPWFGSITGVPAFSDNWIFMTWGVSPLDGSGVLDDPDSPMDGQVIDNMNGGNGGIKRFIRGSTSSGTTGGTECHSHATCGVTNTSNQTPFTVAFCSAGTCVMKDDHFHCFVSASKNSGTLPSYIEAPWIIRIK